MDDVNDTTLKPIDPMVSDIITMMLEPVADALQCLAYKWQGESELERQLMGLSEHIRNIMATLTPVPKKIDCGGLDEVSKM